MAELGGGPLGGPQAPGANLPLGRASSGGAGKGCGAPGSSQGAREEDKAQLLDLIRWAVGAGRCGLVPSFFAGNCSCWRLPVNIPL